MISDGDSEADAKASGNQLIFPTPHHGPDADQNVDFNFIERLAVKSGVAVVWCEVAKRSELKSLYG